MITRGVAIFVGTGLEDKGAALSKLCKPVV